jgi:hypothetical protein
MNTSCFQKMDSIELTVSLRNLKNVCKYIVCTADLFNIVSIKNIQAGIVLVLVHLSHEYVYTYASQYARYNACKCIHVCTVLYTHAIMRVSAYRTVINFILYNIYMMDTGWRVLLSVRLWHIPAMVDYGSWCSVTLLTVVSSSDHSRSWVEIQSLLDWSCLRSNTSII